MLKREGPYSNFAADAVLLGISAFWGTSFALVKVSLAETSPANFLLIRFALACLFLLPFAWMRRETFSVKFLKPGLITGLLLFSAFLTQAGGLLYTSASRSGFITGLNVILVPLLSVLFLKTVPGLSQALGAAMAFLGLFLLTSMDQVQGLPFNWGDFLTLICAVFWAFHIIALGRYSPGADAFWLTLAQLGTACLGSLIWVVFSGELDLALSPSVWGAAVYLAFACTVLAYLGQTWAQGRTTPTRTAIILTMEPVFAALFAWWWLKEGMGLWGMLGAGLILGGILLAEVKVISPRRSLYKT